MGVNDGQGALGEVDEIPGDVGDGVDVGADARDAVDEGEHGLVVGALLEGVDAADGLVGGGVAADAPDRVGGVKNEAAVAQGAQASLEVVGDVFY